VHKQLSTKLSIYRQFIARLMH